MSAVEDKDIGGFRDCDMHLKGWGPLMELSIDTNWATMRMELNEDMAAELRNWLTAWIEDQR